MVLYILLDHNQTKSSSRSNFNLFTRFHKFLSHSVPVTLLQELRSLKLAVTVSSDLG